MRLFARLHEELDTSTASGDKLAALRRYFEAAPADDAAWAVVLLLGARLRPVVGTAVVREAACRRAGIDAALFEVCYQAVGDLAETVAHVLPVAITDRDAGLAHWVRERLPGLRGLAAEEQQQRLIAAWDELDAPGRLLFVKFASGGFRPAVSPLQVQRALAEHAGLPSALLAQRLAGWTEAPPSPDAAAWQALVAPPGREAGSNGPPYPFFMARPLLDPPESLGDSGHWLVVWQYDGLRAQIVKRAGQVWIWSLDEELMTDRAPEIRDAAGALPDGTVLDGELLAWLPGSDHPASWQLLQQRIQRRSPTPRLLTEAPLRFVAHDLLEHRGADLRAQPLACRRQALEALPDLHGAGVLDVSCRLQAPDWPGYADLRGSARQRGASGCLLGHHEARHGGGCPLGQDAWWAWKLAPMSVDAVLIYAQGGEGRGAGVGTEYTFAVWNRLPADASEAEEVVQAILRREPPRPGRLHLLSLAKVSTGLSDGERAAIDRLVRATTLHRFGPVRSLRPTLVVEIGFDALQPSARHKSALALHQPCMLRIRHDKPLHEADSLAQLHAMLRRA